MAEFAWDDAHVHHWLVPPVDGEWVQAVCRDCPETKQLRTWLEPKISLRPGKNAPRQTVTVYGTRTGDRRKKEARR